jgi:glycosyltransferase involved in cell wall biosynthesis
MSVPLVSIIIINHNYEAFLAEAIESAVAQTYSGIEIIVVDDGSTDNSRTIIEKYANRIQVVLKPNGGQASALNAGFKESHGDIIVLLDADDYLMPGAIQHLIERADSGAFVKIHWPLLQVDESGKQSGKKVPEGKLAEGNLREQLIQYGPAHCGGPPESPPTSGNAWSRKFLENVLPVPEEVFFKGGIDQYLFTLVPLFGDILSIKDPQGYYRVHGENNTLKPDYITNFFKRFDFCCKALSEYLKKIGIEKNPASWPRDHWFHKIAAALDDIRNYIPPDSSFILVDDNAWVAGKTISDRQRYHLIESNGEYGGIASSDEGAIRALEDHLRNGVRYLVFAWSAYWWLDHFHQLRDYLTHSNCILKNERVIIFELGGIYEAISMHKS